MDYAEAQAAFFTPRSEETRDLDWNTPARRLRDAIEPLATVCFWSEPAYDAYAARGLDFLQGYVWGRASALGEPEPAVAAAAFGVFEPGLVADLYASGRAACSLADIRAARAEGVANALGEVLGDPEQADGLRETITTLRSAADAVPTTGRPFFAGWSAVPNSDLEWVQLWHACSTLRELRGDSHLAAVVAAGLDGTGANILTELWIGWEPLSYTGSRAWSPDAMSNAVAGLEAKGLIKGNALTAEGRELREQLETATDRAVQPAIDAIGEDLEPVINRLKNWADRIVDHGWFPPDPYKRAAG